MQNYVSMAIRSNNDNLYQMKRATGAVLWQCTVFEDESYRNRGKIVDVMKRYIVQRRKIVDVMNPDSHN